MILRNTLLDVLASAELPLAVSPLVSRRIKVPLFDDRAVVLKGVRRSGKSTLQRQLMKHRGRALYCNFEDTRLYGLTPADFPAMISAMPVCKTATAQKG